MSRMSTISLSPLFRNLRLQQPSLSRGFVFSASKQASRSSSSSLLDSSIPLPPKAPLSSYAIFFTEYYPTVRDKYLSDEGKVNAKEVAKDAGKKWNEMSEDAKKVYNQRSKSAAEEYKSAYTKYYQSLTPSQLSVLNSTLSKPLTDPSLLSVPAKQRRAAARAKTGEPKRLTGFFLFMQEWRKSDELKELIEKEGIETGKVQIFAAKKGGEKWAMMKPEEKQKYSDESSTLAEAHKKWKAEQEEK